jgi:putative transposase
MTNVDDPASKPSRRSIRLGQYDYSTPGYYFVTICTKGKKPLFGRVDDSGVVLSRIGWAARRFLIGIPNHFPDGMIDEHIIMPNHVHAIIVIHSVGAAYMPPAKPDPEAAMPSSPGSLSIVIQTYKSAVTRWCMRNGYHNFAWQRGFYEHVIRNDNDLNEIRRYIANNPSKWIDDDYFIA